MSPAQKITNRPLRSRLRRRGKRGALSLRQCLVRRHDLGVMTLELALIEAETDGFEDRKVIGETLLLRNLVQPAVDGSIESGEARVTRAERTDELDFGLIRGNRLREKSSEDIPEKRPPRGSADEVRSRARLPVPETDLPLGIRDLQDEVVVADHPPEDTRIDRPLELALQQGHVDELTERRSYRLPDVAHLALAGGGDLGGGELSDILGHILSFPRQKMVDGHCGRPVLHLLVYYKYSYLSIVSLSFTDPVSASL